MLLQENSKLLFIGDSITDCERARPVGEVNGWGNGYVNAVGGMLSAFAPELRLRVVNMGVSGNRIRDLAGRWQTDVLDQKPDYVAVMIGVNDVWRHFDSTYVPGYQVNIEEYTATYGELVAKTLPHVKNMILMTPFYIINDMKNPMRSKLCTYQAAVKKTAEEHKTIYCDVQAAFDKFTEHVHYTSISEDGVHPNGCNPTGSFIIAGAFLRAIGFGRGN